MTTAGAPQDDGGHGVRIGRVAGIPVFLAPSWFVIAVVIVAVVSGPVLSTRPAYGIGLGVAQALLLLVSVLVHEGAHALTARAFGMPVIRIVATLWGGHTSFEPGRSTPGRMAVVAAAGPAANAVLAGIGFALLPAVDPAFGSDVVAHLLEGLVIINGSLAVLNILPGMPLDGGQVVECLVWKVTGDRNRGAVVAGWCGRVVAALVVLWFLGRPLLRGESLGLSSLWVLVIGSVLWSGATESIRRGQALSLIGRFRVADVMERAVPMPPGTPVAVALSQPDAVVTVDEHGVPCLVFPSARDGRPEGIDPQAPLLSAVSRIPAENVVEVPPDADLMAVVAAMQATSFPTVVVTSQGRPYGIAHSRLVNEVLSRN
ncbi:site-2 protease family protein [Nostocoides sp. HKS02]|uniref:site-2 protease family protein n=1 Tax=Nostocoides sp. HKS02 TaxID=1813880 RepID=UPI0012B4DF12|nr:site-2 protease family protein [Tetrasphaera sp. HKS02]QGN57274.1 peptidase M50 [Tetrasphaera sp. HKS02]